MRTLIRLNLNLIFFTGLLVRPVCSQDVALLPACENLKSLSLPETTIHSAQLVPQGGFSVPPQGGGIRGGVPPAGDRMPVSGLETQKGGTPRPSVPGASDLPSFCRVIGVISPAINFEVWLPPASGEKSWNGKLDGVGNGGLAGSLSYGAMIQALARGYATASTDTGHANKPGNEAWALGHPELLVDFASRSIHMTTITAKGIIKAYYRREPQYSYFTGCSGGGGQALSEAQRYPADYQGIVAGAPANYPTRMWPGELFAAWVAHRDTASMIPDEKLPLITRAVLEACDNLDGIKDGLIADPRQCKFDPIKIQCRTGDSSDCLTTAQVDSVKKIYAGLINPVTKELFWYGYEMSSEAGWPGHIKSPFNVPLSYFKYMAIQNPDWDWRTFDFSDARSFALLEDASKKLSPTLDSINPELAPFKKLGGKLIQYHGWIDQNISPQNSIHYYQSVEKSMGGKQATQDFYRLFLAPGMAHCGGGPGPNTLDCLSALEQWVEKGNAPDQIVATHSMGGKVDRSRPLCPYPQVALYKGSGSTDDAINFSCK